MKLLRDAPIVGNFARDPDSKVKFSTLAEGERLTLVLEPSNAFDPLAVKVMCGDLHLGYIPKTMSAVLYGLPAKENVSLAECTVSKTGTKGKSAVPEVLVNVDVAE